MNHHPNRQRHSCPLHSNHEIARKMDFDYFSKKILQSKGARFFDIRTMRKTPPPRNFTYATPRAAQ
jgi:hypothetical protein